MADPAGTWGLGKLTTQSKEEAERIAVEDPAIKADLGFAFEVLPMVRTVLGTKPAQV